MDTFYDFFDIVRDHLSATAVRPTFWLLSAGAQDGRGTARINPIADQKDGRKLECSGRFYVADSETRFSGRASQGRACKKHPRHPMARGKNAAAMGYNRDLECGSGELHSGRQLINGQVRQSKFPA